MSALISDNLDSNYNRGLEDIDDDTRKELYGEPYTMAEIHAGIHKNQLMGQLDININPGSAFLAQKWELQREFSELAPEYKSDLGRRFDAGLLKSKIYHGGSEENNPFIGSDGNDMTADMDDSANIRAIRLAKLQNQSIINKQLMNREHAYLRKDFSKSTVQDGVIPTYGKEIKLENSVFNNEFQGASGHKPFSGKPRFTATNINSSAIPTQQTKRESVDNSNEKTKVEGSGFKSMLKRRSKQVKKTDSRKKKTRTDRYLEKYIKSELRKYKGRE